ncbi:DUF3048 domain-containing protein [Patescibacteria group bacterium]
MNLKQIPKKYYLILLLVIVFIVSGCALVRILNYKITDIEPQVIIREEQEEILRRKIDGQAIDDETKANLYPVAIMVENNYEAWPLSGLNKAQIVIEAITEASIPRFVAIYATDEDIAKIGPVRSARPYYLDWINPLAPVYMHVGGSPEALRSIRNNTYDINDLDQFFHYQYYWRDNKWRYAPHNVYTSSELIKEALADKELTEPEDYQMWSYKEDLQEDDRPEQVDDVIISYSNSYYKASWQYDREANDYIRYQKDKINKMSDNEWLRAKNIIVQINDMKVIDNIGRKKITTIGEGKAWVFRDGQVIEGRWVKESIKDREKYFDNEDNEVKFNGGVTWVQIIPSEDYLSF